MSTLVQSLTFRSANYVVPRESVDLFLFSPLMAQMRLGSYDAA